MRWIVGALLVLAGCASEQPSSSHDAGVDVGPARVDGGVDAAPVDGPCAMSGRVPSWIETTDRAHHVIARGAIRDVHLWAFDDGLLRVRYVPASTAPIERSFALVTPANEMAPAAITIDATDDGAFATICSDTFVATIEREGMRVVVRDRAGTVLLEDAPDVAPSAREVVRISPRDELFTGLGERTGPFDRRGRRAIVWTTDAYDPAHGGFAPDADPLYLAIPFFVAVRGAAASEAVAYGLFTDVAYRQEYDLAASDPDRYGIRSAGPELDQWLIAGPHPRDVLRRYSSLTGRTPRPPRWSLGFHQSRWGYHDVARMDRLASDFRANDVPADALWLDIQHMDAFRTFTFDPLRFGDPEGLASRLDARGFSLIVIADPGLKVDPGWSVHDRVVAGGLYLRNPDGTPHVASTWASDSLFLDFTMPAARALWSEEITRLARRGIDGIWLDVNEPTTFPESGGENTVPNDLPIHGDGIATTMAEGHNVYALLQARATREGLREAHPDRRPFILCRAGFAGIQREAAVWTGDAPSTWWSLEQVLPMLLGTSMSGVPFVGSDVGGYSGHATPELFARWMALGSISPFFRAHQTNGPPDAEPWSFGSEVLDISRARIRARYALTPYLVSLFDEHERTGAPVLRPMMYEHFEDRALRDVGDQAMLGPFLLVAPITREGATTREVRLPSGRWYEVDSGAIVEGPRTIEVGATLAALPTFVREGAILPRVSGDVASTRELGGTLFLDVYPSARESTFTLVEDAGDGYGATSRTTLTLGRHEAGARLVIGAREGDFDPGARTIELRVWRVDGVVRGVRVGGVEQAFVHDENERTLIVRMADPGAAGATIELDYDVTIIEPSPPLDVVLEVEVPESTPVGSVVHVASSANGWTHAPLEVVHPGLARGTLRVGRGEWFEYKYTRGTWDTVEKWPGCVEATNRYGLGRAGVRRDRVFEWRDVCE
ncbi:TIM-barrel domain-containing protein [Sandaracinus amylolyticus]|uniref:Alpha-glucosidase n=1 Tax=Sandaracinus amylolyticus TaxID=927083 RepID=A0A0F6W9E7_9BACT|nr:TIM-barrel domain-containing protein [Sandaracinus amylolyticus]AKF10761.1 Alpha-glucosidase [Sandaracinus amylolyticus]